MTNERADGASRGAVVGRTENDATRSDARVFTFGPSALELLIPARRPFRFVDRITEFSLARVEHMLAIRAFNANEPYFDGHYPNLPIVPGTLVQEGLSQACGLYWALRKLCSDVEAAGGTALRALELLRNVDLGARLDPSYRPGEGDEIVGPMRELPMRWVGMLASANMRFRKPVFPGDIAEFRVRLTRQIDALWHFETEATVNGQTTTQGTIAIAMMPIRLPGA